MKRRYDGLKAMKIAFASTDIAANDVVTPSNNCVAMIQLELENGVCISPEWEQQVTYVGDKG